MRNPLALHTWTLDTTPLGRVLEIARETGWQAVELRRLDFARAAERGQAAEAVLDLVRSSGLATACVGVALGWMWAEGDERAKLLRAFDESCRWAKALGCRTVMSPVDRGRGDAARAAASIGEVGDIAARHGVRLALEFNSQCDQFNTLGRSAGGPRQGRASPRRAPARCLSPRQERGAARGPRPRPRRRTSPTSSSATCREAGSSPGQALDRLPPGQGSVPFKEFFAAIERRGYAGYCSYEAPNPAAWARDPAAVAREALEATRAAAR